MKKLFYIQDHADFTEIVPIPLVSDKRRASSGKDLKYEQALPAQACYTISFLLRRRRMHTCMTD